MKLKILLTSFIYTLIGLLLLVQTNIVWAVVSDPNNPITAAITSAITGGDNHNPSPTPSPTPTPAPTSAPAPTNLTVVNLVPASSSLTPIGYGTLTVTITEINPSGAVGVIEEGYISGSFTKLIANSLYTIWLIEDNFSGFSPVRSDQMVSDQNGNINFFNANFEIYHRVDKPIQFVGIGLRSLDLSSSPELCSKFNPCLSSPVTLPAVTTVLSSAPSATPSATPTATPSAQPISAPITDDSSNCLDFWIFQICLLDLTPAPISTPVVNPTPTPNPSPTPSPTPTPTPIPVPTPKISTIFPNPANWQTVIVLSGSNLTNSAQIYIDNS